MGLLPSWLTRTAAGAAAVAAGALTAHLDARAGQPPEPRPSSVPAEQHALEVAPPSAPEPPPAAPLPLPDTTGLDPVRSDLGGGAVVTGSSRQRIILFTFDDGPDPRYTRRLLDLLDRRGVRAVFFLSGDRFAGPTAWARDNREIVREIAARGHVLASHGHRHIQFTRLPTFELVRELDAADAAFVEALGVRPALIRPPGGARSPRTDAVLAARGYTTFLWNLGTGDAQVRTADEVVETFRRVLIAREHENGARGGVVLLHDIHAWSLEAFPRILDHLEHRNCALWAEGEELYDVLDDPAPFVAARGEGSPSDEAPWAALSEEEHEVRQAILRERTGERCGRLALR
jgi:peptidoglycan/xylan/chitin deacetylase (PgdA/CDA1 family)